MSLSKKGAKQHFLRLFEIIDIHFRSEIHAVMTGGFATIAGTVLAAYISFGIPAAQLISASVMAAPTALAVSKLIYPETEESKTTVVRTRLNAVLEERTVKTSRRAVLELAWKWSN